MNKAELNQKLSDLEDEAAKLRSLINQPEQREPEAGDVWNYGGGFTYTIGRDGHGTELRTGIRTSGRFNLDLTDCTYLGKFDEVFVKISDVRDALSLRDGYDNNILEWLEDGDLEPRSGSIIKTYEALLNLNIIK